MPPGLKRKPHLGGASTPAARRGHRWAFYSSGGDLPLPPFPRCCCLFFHKALNHLIEGSRCSPPQLMSREMGGKKVQSTLFESEAHFIFTLLSSRKFCNAAVNSLSPLLHSRHCVLSFRGTTHWKGDAGSIHHGSPRWCRCV